MSRHRALLLDAFGTLLRVDRPAERLAASLRARLGVEIDHDRAAATMRAELSYYQANCRRAADRAALETLERECAAIVMELAGVTAEEREALAVLSDAVVITAYPDATPALAWARSRGLATAVVSNGDCSLPSQLGDAGLAVDVTVDAATCGVAKPDPAIFAIALTRLGVSAAEALHVGDHDPTDGAGARAAGIDVVILDRSEEPAPGTIASLAELERVVR
jgi:putative hydrolase of the HAD superfamily